MEQELRVEVLATLLQIRQELQGNAEDSVICQLDQAIQDLETAERGTSAAIIEDLVVLLGKILENLPAIVGLLEVLRQWYR